MVVVIEGLGEQIFYNKKVTIITNFVTNITSFVIGKTMVKIMVKQWLGNVFQGGALLFKKFKN